MALLLLVAALCFPGDLVNTVTSLDDGDTSAMVVIAQRMRRQAYMLLFSAGSIADGLHHL